MNNQYELILEYIQNYKISGENKAISQLVKQNPVFGELFNLVCFCLDVSINNTTFNNMWSPLQHIEFLSDFYRDSLTATQASEFIAHLKNSRVFYEKTIQLLSGIRADTTMDEKTLENIDVQSDALILKMIKTHFKTSLFQSVKRWLSISNLKMPVPLKFAFSTLVVLMIVLPFLKMFHDKNKIEYTSFLSANYILAQHNSTLRGFNEENLSGTADLVNGLEIARTLIIEKKYESAIEKLTSLNIENGRDNNHYLKDKFFQLGLAYFGMAQKNNEPYLKLAQTSFEKSQSLTDVNESVYNGNENFYLGLILMMQKDFNGAKTYLAKIDSNSIFFNSAQKYID